MIKKKTRKTKKKKAKASVTAIKSANMKIIDPIEIASNKFISEYKNKIMYHRFNKHCFIKVKVIGKNENKIKHVAKYENIICKVIQKEQKWIKSLKYGQYIDVDNKSHKMSSIKKGTIIVVNHLSLVDLNKIDDILKILKDEYTTNKNAIITSSKFIDESLYVVNSIEEYLKKRKIKNDQKNKNNKVKHSITNSKKKGVNKSKSS